MISGLEETPARGLRRQRRQELGRRDDGDRKGHEVVGVAGDQVVGAGFQGADGPP